MCAYLLPRGRCHSRFCVQFWNIYGSVAKFNKARKALLSAQISDGSKPIKLFCRRKVLIGMFCEFQLFLLNHIHEFNTSNGS